MLIFESGRAGEKRALELGGGLRRPAGFVDAREVEPRELDDAVLERLADLHVAIERRAEAAVHVAEHAEAGLDP